MSKLLIGSLFLASSCLASPAVAQTNEIDALRAQIEALQAQVSVLSERLGDIETDAQAPAQAQTPGQPVTVAAPPTPVAAPATDDAAEISFAGAPEIEAGGGWSFKPFGRIQADAGVIALPQGLALDDGFGSELRRARIGLAGDIPGGFGYKVEVDFAGNAAELTDVFVTYEDDGLTLTAGQHNTFQSLEELTSSRFSSFIERAAFTDAFGFERRLGLSAQYSHGDILLQAGVFTDNIDDLPGESWSADGRAVFSPKAGDTQLHFGGSLHYTELASGDTVRYRQRPLVHFTSARLIDTGNIGADSEFGAGLEAGMISGPLHAVAEGYWQSLAMPGVATDPTFFGGYAEVGYFLTPGDRRGYKGGKFDRTRPASPVDEGGIGAIQLNLRYDYLDLNDANIIGGVQNGYTASLVWVPTDYTRLLLNYGRLAYDDAIVALPNSDTSYNADVVGMRIQIDY